MVAHGDPVAQRRESEASGHSQPPAAGIRPGIDRVEQVVCGEPARTRSRRRSTAAPGRDAGRRPNSKHCCSGTRGMERGVACAHSNNVSHRLGLGPHILLLQTSRCPALPFPFGGELAGRQGSMPLAGSLLAGLISLAGVESPDFAWREASQRHIAHPSHEVMIMTQQSYNRLTDALQAGKITRREFVRRAMYLGVSFPAASLLASACATDPESNSDTITLVSYGGSYNETLRQTMIDPFEQESGVSVSLGENTGLAPLKLQVESGNVQWDLAELNGPEYEVAVRQELLEPYNYSLVDTSQVPDFAVREFGIKYALYLFVMGWDQRVIAEGETPTGWAQFFDSQLFPGKRSLYDRIDEGSVLEVALMAEGVPFDEIYPLDVDRALSSLETFGRDMFIWHTAPQEAIQSLVSAEVALATTWNGRVGIAQRDEGAEIGFTPNQAVVSGNYLVVPKGAPNSDMAFQLMNFIATNAKAGADYARMTHYAISNNAAIDLLEPELAAKLPTSPDLEGKILVKDDAWWADNLEPATEAFKEWQLGDSG